MPTAHARVAQHTRSLAATLLILVAGGAPGEAAEATLRADTQRAWEVYVANTESRMATELSTGRAFLVMNIRNDGTTGDVPIAEVPVVDDAGRPLAVPGGTITHWRGAVLVPGITLDQLLERARCPSERGPFPPDVLMLRVLERRPDGLRLFIKMTRQALVRVTYNTEHAVEFQRHGPTRASSRSIATKIAEVAATSAGERERSQADDRGFLWRLNAYWRYEQVSAGVIAELESVSLSRGIPTGLGLVARPIVNRVARESMARTLVAFRDEQLRNDEVRPCSGMGS